LIAWQTAAMGQGADVTDVVDVIIMDVGNLLSQQLIPQNMPSCCILACLEVGLRSLVQNAIYPQTIMGVKLATSHGA
jgi:hypothetical protein